MYQQHYQRFLSANPNVQHFSCHSHYYWPDVTRQAMLDYWDDSARLADDKWAFFFSDLIPTLQQHISNLLNTGLPGQIVFAPNTHELVMRLLSCLPTDTIGHILTTDSEFHSFNRQITRLEEAGLVTVTRISSQPFDTLQERMQAAVSEQCWDLVFFSQVLFNSGFQLDDVNAIVYSANPNAMVVIDGYHSFMARPVDLSLIKQRAFFIAGGYKYAQAGEGACFMHVPPGQHYRPRFTGWYAEFGALHEARSGQTRYADNGMQFAGATMDFCALYRMRAVFELFEREGLTVPVIDHYIKQLQQEFLTRLNALHHPLLNYRNLLVNDVSRCGHFLTFALPDEVTAGNLHQQLRDAGIKTDYRGHRLRFGFGLYHTAQDMDLSALARCV